MTYWVRVLPLSKKVSQHIDSLCRSFLWSGKEVIVRKAPVAWEKVWQTKIEGGLKIISMCFWRQALCAKLLWNSCSKSDKLWVKWFHIYYMKMTSVIDCQIKASMSCSSLKMKLRFSDILSFLSSAATD